MKPAAAREYLEETLEQMQKASAWLQRSRRLCQDLTAQTELEESDWDKLETLSGRFARLCDLIIHKVFRALDRYELEPPGTLLDVLNRAERRRLIDSVDDMRALKDLRNEIAHEYAEDDLRRLHEEIMRGCPRLLDVVRRIDEYAARLLPKPPG